MSNSGQASTTGHIYRNYMQPDIMFRVFEKLPIETIMTCKCVCKEWRSIIEDPLFIEQQRLFSVHQAPRALLYQEFGILPLYLVDCESHKARPLRIPQALNPLGEALFVTSTCDGLVCIASDERETPVYIYNPVLGQLVKLPSNGFEGEIIYHRVGIVYHDSSSSYKVVRVYELLVTGAGQKQDNFRFEMITLGEGAWTELLHPPLFHESCIWDPLEWRGAIHWKIRPLINGPQYIMSFDVDTKAFQIVNFIENPPDYARMRILVLNDNLVIMKSETSCVKTWKLEGNTVGEYFIGYYSVMEIQMKWRRHPVYCTWIAETDRDGVFILQATCYIEPMPSVSVLLEFSPETGTYTRLNLSGMPADFVTLSFKPTLVSPMRAINALEDV